MSSTESTMPSNPLDLGSTFSLDFEKEYQVRNFFNSSITLQRLPLAANEPRMPTGNSVGELLFSDVGASACERHMRLGDLYPYAAIDLEVERQTQADAQIILHKDPQNRVVFSRRADGTVSLEIFRDGERVKCLELFEGAFEAPYTLRVHMSGEFLSFFLVKDDTWDYLRTVLIGDEFDLRRKSLCADFSVLVGARLDEGGELGVSRAEQYLTCGTGQADPKVLHYEDGTPITEGSKIWLAMTTRGYDPIPASHQGVYSYDIATREWTLVGDMTFDRGDGLLRSWHATDIFYDRDDHTWKVFTVSHGDDHCVYLGACANDPREGISEVQVRPVDYPSKGNEEDPSVLYDETAAKWRMAMCIHEGDGYQTVLFEAEAWDGEWTEIARNTATSSTGILIQRLGDKRYVLQGRGESNCEILSYPKLEKQYAFTVPDQLTSYNVWPVIIPFPEEAGTAYYMLTFDRSRTTGKYSYGDLYWYRVTLR